jgi:hypothetical protein
MVYTLSVSKVKRVVKRSLWSGAKPNMMVDSVWVPRGHAQRTQGFSDHELVFWNASKKCGVPGSPSVLRGNVYRCIL